MKLFDKCKGEKNCKNEYISTDCVVQGCEGKAEIFIVSKIPRVRTIGLCKHCLEKNLREISPKSVQNFMYKAEKKMREKFENNLN